MTAMGKDRMYRLGKYIRNRYGDYLSDDIKEVKALSSDKDRCIESVLMSVSGAYPPQKNEKCDENILRLVPVHTNPQPVDSVSYIFSEYIYTNFLTEKILVEVLMSLLYYKIPIADAESGFDLPGGRESQKSNLRKRACQRV